jgi:hypothetical protein
MVIFGINFTQMCTEIGSLNPLFLKECMYLKNLRKLKKLGLNNQMIEKMIKLLTSMYMYLFCCYPGRLVDPEQRQPVLWGYPDLPELRPDGGPLHPGSRS